MKMFERAIIEKMANQSVVSHYDTKHNCPKCPIRDFCEPSKASLVGCLHMWKTYFESDEMAWEGILRITKPYKREDTDEQ